MCIIKTLMLFMMLTGVCCGLYCYGCRDTPEERTCSHLERFEHLNCTSNYICVKHVVHYEDAEDKAFDLVTRNCRPSNLSVTGVNNECKYDHAMSKPHSGLTCLCYDKDYCNHATSFVKLGTSYFIWATVSLVLYL